MTRPAPHREPDPHSRIDDERMFQDALAEFGVTPEELRHRSRKADAVAKRRSVALTLRMSGMSFPRIGRLIGRDHKTVMHLCGCEPGGRV